MNDQTKRTWCLQSTDQIKPKSVSSSLPCSFLPAPPSTPRKASFISALCIVLSQTQRQRGGTSSSSRVCFSHLVQEAQVIFSMTMASVTCFPRGTSCTWRLQAPVDTCKRRGTTFICFPSLTDPLGCLPQYVQPQHRNTNSALGYKAWTRPLLNSQNGVSPNPQSLEPMLKLIGWGLFYHSSLLFPKVLTHWLSKCDCTSVTGNLLET